MSTSSLGEPYFDTRIRLTGVMDGIASLAEETGADLGGLLPGTSPESSLYSPFRLLACGEVNAGKSSLLNGLAGTELCATAVLPETDRIIHYRFGNPPKISTPSPLVEERRLNADFLRDFELIDTPGTNSPIEGVADSILELAPTADLLLFTFPVANPWGASTWDLLSRLPADLFDRAILVLQQADQRSPEDIRVILGHMADLSTKRCGRIPPVFAVSATKAAEARSSRSMPASLLDASGYPALEEYITSKVCLSPTRRAALDSTRQQTARALRLVDDRIDSKKRSLSHQNHFIDEVEREIDTIRETFLHRLPDHLQSVAATFESEARTVSRRLNRQLGALPSMFRLFSGDRTGARAQTSFIETLQDAVTRVAEYDGAEAVATCQAHWDSLEKRITETIGVPPETNRPISETLDQSRQHFVARIGDAARSGITGLKVRNQLDRDLRKRNKSLKSFTATTLLFTTAGATCGALSVPWAPAVLCGIALLFFLGGVLTAWITRRSITRDFQNRLLDTCGAFASTLRDDYDYAIRSIFRDYSAALDHTRAHLIRERQAAEPRAKRWQQLFVTLKTMEQETGP